MPAGGVDEAHGISEWGHDFRPEYLAIGGMPPALGDGAPPSPELLEDQWSLFLELLVWGFGPSERERFGATALEVVRNARRDREIAS